MVGICAYLIHNHHARANKSITERICLVVFWDYSVYVYSTAKKLASHPAGDGLGLDCIYRQLEYRQFTLLL